LNKYNKEDERNEEGIEKKRMKVKCREGNHRGK
jgi:hypothetical protein